MNKKEKVLAWHFLKDDRTLRYSNNKKVIKKGTILKVDADKLKMCRYGLHASIKPLDALAYAPGNVITLCELSGTIIKGQDKLCASERKVLHIFNANTLLHVFACDIAENVLNDNNMTDKRCWNAIDTKIKWLVGQASSKELATARDAARDAAWYAAYAARDDARYAAYGVRDAARDAAWYAAYAARDAAYAARDAARYAERAQQNRHLEQMLYDAITMGVEDEE